MSAFCMTLEDLRGQTDRCHVDLRLQIALLKAWSCVEKSPKIVLYTKTNILIYNLDLDLGVS